MKKLIFVWTLLFMIIAIPVFAEDEYDYKSQEFKVIASQFLCMCGCGQDHYECNMAGCGVNDAFITEIKEMMDNDMDNDEIKAYFVDIYGEEILTAPKKSGFSLTAWVLPFVALGGAGTGVFFALRKWIAEGIKFKKSSDGTTDEDKVEDETESEILKSVIDEERKKYY